MRKLLKIARERVQEVEVYKNKPILSQWINTKTVKEEFSAIHFASFNGNIEMCQMLLEEGAEKTVMNKHGLSCLHVAAQGDQPGSLYYFHKVQSCDIQ